MTMSTTRKHPSPISRPDKGGVTTAIVAHTLLTAGLIACIKFELVPVWLAFAGYVVLTLPLDLHLFKILKERAGSAPR